MGVSYHAKKRLGQNFLISDKTIRRIVELTAVGPASRIVEIGAGRGALTAPLAETGAHVWAVEFDRDLIGYLEKLLARFEHAHLIHGDFLEFVPDSGALPRFTLVGNLPYNITSPVIDWCVRYADRIDRAVLMVQSELAERLAACPGSKNWSPLSIAAQSHFRIEARFQVSAKDFRPAPKVLSAVLELIPLQAPLCLPDCFLGVVRTAFTHRRKLLLNNLVPALVADPQAAKDILHDCAFPPTIRAEQMTIEQFLTLTAHLARRKLV